LGQAIPKCDIKLVYGIPSLHSWYLGFQQSFKNKLFYKKSADILTTQKKKMPQKRQQYNLERMKAGSVSSIVNLLLSNDWK
jgi:hypothetical protein